MQVRISEDTYKTIKDIIDEEIWDTEQEIKDYAGYDCETAWRERWLKELEIVQLNFVEGARMSNKDDGVDHSVSEHMDKVMSDIANGRYVSKERKPMSAFTKLLLVALATASVMALLPVVVSIFFEWCEMWGFYSANETKGVALAFAELVFIVLSALYAYFIYEDRNK